MLRRKQNGFTIVEVIVVVIIIGILAGIGIVAYSGWKDSLAKSAVQHDLESVRTALDSARTWDNKYPTITDGATFDGSNPQAAKLYTQSKDVVITYVAGDATGYCLDARSKVKSSIAMYIKVSPSSTNNSLQQGDCTSTFPTPVLTVARSDEGVLDLSWQAIPGISTYTITRSTSASFSNPVTVDAITGTSYTDRGLLSGTNYYYKIKATASKPSNVASQRTPYVWLATKTQYGSITCTSGTCAKEYEPNLGLVNGATKLVENKSGDGYFIAFSNMDCMGSGCSAGGDLTITLYTAGTGLQFYSNLSGGWTTSMTTTTAIRYGTQASYVLMDGLRFNGTISMGQLTLRVTTNNPNISIKNATQMFTFTRER